MKTATSTSASLTGRSAWAAVRPTPFIVVLAGIDSSRIVDAALTDTALTEAVVPRLEPGCAPPCDALLWRLETASGKSVNHPGLLARQWHRKPYALTLRLVQYQPGSVVPEILDEGTLGTRGNQAGFRAAVDRLTMRFVRDAARGRGRGPAGAAPAATAHGLPGWLEAFREKWHARLMTEWWSIGSTGAALDQVLTRGDLGAVHWYNIKAGSRYLADPFPWPGTGRILCEEMPLTNGVGRIVHVTERDGMLSPPSVILDDGWHHSYPCTFVDNETTYCVPEATQRGATHIHQLESDGRLVPVCDVAPHARLADPTLFRWNGQYWLGCTDLDLGGHDNFCLLHSSCITGPWIAHDRWPVKIDIRGARAAGMVFSLGGRLFRPAQDCAATYGAGVVVHEILTLTEAEYREVAAAELRPDKAGPFPDGLHTLAHDGERFWVDGKRYILDPGSFWKKLRGRASGLISGMGVD